MDVFEVMGLKHPDVSILSEEFLEEVRSYEYKNLAVEMLKKLLEGNIKTMERRNLVKSQKYSEKLKQSLNKYKNQAITNAEVIEELIQMAKDMKKEREEEKDLGLNEDEIAFYDALTSESIVKELMEDEVLRKIANELTQAIRRNMTIDWHVRKSAHAGMRRIIKRLLKKYDYPPEQAKKALDTVMRQAELMAENTEVRDWNTLQAAESKSEYEV